MPVAGGVPCVGSTFYFPRRYLKFTTCVNNLHYEVNGHLRQKGKIAELALEYGVSVGALKSISR